MPAGCDCAYLHPGHDDNITQWSCSSEDGQVLHVEGTWCVRFASPDFKLLLQMIGALFTKAMGVSGPVAPGTFRHANESDKQLIRTNVNNGKIWETMYSAVVMSVGFLYIIMFSYVICLSCFFWRRLVYIIARLRFSVSFCCMQYTEL